jgi:hypothetical protein
MTAALLEAANEALRNAVRDRLDATPADDPKMRGCSPLAGCQPAQECAAQVLADAWRGESCCEGGKCQPKTVVVGQDVLDEWAEFERDEPRQTGDGVKGDAVHPTSQAYFDLLDTLRQLHISKSLGYGSPDGTDPLLNIRRGAEFVGIPAWQGAMVRLSDKVTRLSVFNKTGNLPHESVEDTLLDLASYSLLALLLYREERA